MPVLINPRYERFAQELAKGETGDAAYVAAGYAKNRCNAARLKSNETIQNRIKELTIGVAQRAEITVDLLIGYLHEARILAAKTNQPNAIVAAVKEMGILSGKRIEKHENTNRNISEMSDDDLAAIAATGRRDAPAETPPSPRTH